MCIHVHKRFHMDFPKQLKALREENGLSLEELAEETGLEAIKLKQYESGYSHPSLSEVKKIAAALDIKDLALLGYPR